MQKSNDSSILEKAHFTNPQKLNY